MWGECREPPSPKDDAQLHKLESQEEGGTEGGGSGGRRGEARQRSAVVP